MRLLSFTVSRSFLFFFLSIAARDFSLLVISYVAPCKHERRTR